jgi:ABC-2 type transport system permease protein
MTVILVTYYTHGAGDARIGLSQAVSMTWLGQIAMNLLPGFGMDFAVYNKVRSGDVGCELLKPLDIYEHWYASAMAVKLTPFLSAVIPVSASALLMPGDLKLIAPVSPMHLTACLISLMSGLILSCALICLSYAMCMDARAGDGIARLFMAIAQVFAGMILPLQLWPDWAQGFLRRQPFAGTLDLPLRFYIGSAHISELGGVLMSQLLWAAGMIALGRVWISRNLRKLVIQGG